MLIGLYKLVFNNTDKVYVGQSANLERRKLDYTRAFNTGNLHSTKLKEALELYGKPTFEVLEICSLSELDNKEIDYINKYNSINYGFNTLLGTEFRLASPSSPDNHSCLYDKEDYLNILYLGKDPKYSYKQISKELGVSYYVVHNILTGNTNHWLQEAKPELYKEVMELRGSRLTAKGRGIVYPTIIHEDGRIVDNIESVREFAISIGLKSHAGITQLLNGKSYYCGGFITLDWLTKVTSLLTKSKDYRKIATEVGVPYRSKRIEAIDKKELFVC